MQNSITVQNCANALRRKLGSPCPSPRLGLILGTGLGSIANKVLNPTVIPFAELPGFPLSTVSSHAGRFLLGQIYGQECIVQQGRCHIYEGYSPEEVCAGVRVMGLLGVKTLIVTNAAGSLNPLFSSGSVMAITDQINFTGLSPLRGPNKEELGPRFPDMSAAYDRALLALAEQSALDCGIRLEKGIYLGLVGPQMETPAETRMFRKLGADAVGMSTVLEVIAARHMGLRVAGFSCLSNQNLPDCMTEAPLEDVISRAGQAGEDLCKVIIRMCEHLTAKGKE